MWKKDETPEPMPYTRPEPTTTPAQPAAPMAPPRQQGQQATIGSSITIRGDVTGDEDLLIQGRVDGSIDLKQHSVTVGQEGQVKANISGRVIAIEGRVEGNLKAEEQVILRSSAFVQGDIVAPRVVLENGARFRGGVDMGESLPASGAQASGKSGNSGRTTAPPSMEAAPRRQPSSTTAEQADGTAQKAVEATS